MSNGSICLAVCARKCPCYKVQTCGPYCCCKPPIISASCCCCKPKPSSVSISSRKLQTPCCCCKLQPQPCCCHKLKSPYAPSSGRKPKTPHGPCCCCKPKTLSAPCFCRKPTCLSCLLKQQARNSARQAQIACQYAVMAAEQSRITTLLSKACKNPLYHCHHYAHHQGHYHDHHHGHSHCQPNEVVVDVDSMKESSLPEMNESVPKKTKTTKITVQSDNSCPCCRPCCSPCTPCAPSEPIHLHIKPTSGRSSPCKVVI